MWICRLMERLGCGRAAVLYANRIQEEFEEDEMAQSVIVELCQSEGGGDMMFQDEDMGDIDLKALT